MLGWLVGGIVGDYRAQRRHQLLREYEELTGFIGFHLSTRELKREVTRLRAE